MAVSEKNNCIGWARIDDHDPSKGFSTFEKCFKEGTPTHSYQRDTDNEKFRASLDGMPVLRSGKLKV